MKGYYFIRNILTVNDGNINELINMVYESDDGMPECEIIDCMEKIPKFSFPSAVYRVDTMDGTVVVNREDNYMSSKIRFLNMVPSATVDNYCAVHAKDMIFSSETRIKINAANRGFGLKHLILDDDERVRAAVADYGYGLDILIKDSSPLVRAIIAAKRYGLKRLINDPDPYVRAAVAREGYKLNKLVNDPSDMVREIVANMAEEDVAKQLINDKDVIVKLNLAERGIGLDHFIHDDNAGVRAEVASYGKYLDILINDPDPKVRIAVYNYVINRAKDDYFNEKVKDFVDANIIK